MIVFGLSSVPLSFAQISLNEFSSMGSSDWIELYNSGDQTENLSGYLLRDNTQNNSKSLEGEIAAKGFFVIEWNNLNQDIDSVILINDEGIEETVMYGTSELIAPSSGQSAGRLEDGSGSWILFSSPTKGSSNVGASVFKTPTPSPTTAPTATKIPTSTKTPVPTKEPVVTSVQITGDQNTLDPASSVSQKIKVSSKSSLLGTSDINESSKIQTKDISRDPFVMSASQSSGGGVYIIGGSSLLFGACGILLFRKYRHKIFP